jgi:hypothetical protein
MGNQRRQTKKLFVFARYFEISPKPTGTTLFLLGLVYCSPLMRNIPDMLALVATVSTSARVGNRPESLINPSPACGPIHVAPLAIILRATAANSASRVGLVVDYFFHMKTTPSTSACC